MEWLSYPPWIMNWLMTRWKVEPWYPKPFSPVARALEKYESVRTILMSKGVPEVLSGFGDGLAIEADDDAAKLIIAVSDIEVDLWALSVMRS